MAQWGNPQGSIWVYRAELFTLWLRDEQSRFVFRGRGCFIDYTGTDSFVLEAARQAADDFRGHATDRELIKLADAIDRAVSAAPRGR